jgi:uncharacterized protein YukE
LKLRVARGDIQMAQIQVRPDDLVANAEQLRGQAQRIQQAVETVDQQILNRMGPAVFSGNRPDMLRSRYVEMQEFLQSFRVMITAFATKLDEAAADFRKADSTNQG